MSTKGNVADKAKMFAERSKADTIYCEKCSKHVLKNAPDHIVFEGIVFHVEDFKCSVCKSHLKLSNAIKYKGELYCSTHNPLRDQNKLSSDTAHRHRSGSISEEYQAIRVKKEHKALQLPQNWLGSSNMKLNSDMKSNSNLSPNHTELKKSLSMLARTEKESVYKNINYGNKVEYEDTKGSIEKLDIEVGRVRARTAQETERSRSNSNVKDGDEQPLRRRLHTDSSLKHVNSVKMKASLSAEKADAPKDFFLDIPDFWYEIDYSNYKPKTNKLPLLIMGDEQLHHMEFGRENMRRVTQLGITTYNNYDMEWVDVSCLYYRHFLKDTDHTNYVANVDEGTVLISVFMEKGESSSDEDVSQPDISNFLDILKDNKYKILMRWKGGLNWRLVFYESEFRNKTSIKTSINRRKILSYLHPSLTPNKLIKISDPTIKDEICKLDELRITTEYKFGVILVKPEQYKEEDVFANKEGSEEYEEFLTILGDKIDLQGFTGYCGGLDPKNSRTGSQSVHTKYNDYEIMYHVSTLLPFDPVDPQQIQRKRHIGNDIVCVVFLEQGAKFNPNLIASKFLHVYVCVQKIKEGWKVVVAANKHIAYFGPQLPNPNIFTDKSKLREYLLTKRNSD